MATKKSSTPVLEETVETPEQEMSSAAAAMQAELERLRKENEQLRMNSVGASSAAGAKSDYERVQDACRKAAEEGADAWSIKISVRAPRKPAKEDPFYWLSINGRTIQIPATDKYYEMALPFAANLRDMIQAAWRANDFADNMEVFDPVNNPHRD